MNQKQKSHKPLVVLGVSGGIAAYKAAEVCRGLIKADCRVIAVMTEAAQQMVGPKTFEALSGEPPVLDLWNDSRTSPHTELGQSADLILVCPATARVVSDISSGKSGDALTATYLASEAPKLVCPAMHTEMWNDSAVQANIASLISSGTNVLGPAVGELAGGDFGPGRLVEPAEIVAEALSIIEHGASLEGVSFLITAGATREPIDAVRYITNRSTGKQGHALAEAAAARGAKVALVTTSSVPSSQTIERIHVETAADMFDAVRTRWEGADIGICAAAVADFIPEPVEGKLSKADGIPEIKLSRSTDILSWMGETKHSGQILMGFSAQDSDDTDVAIAKLNSKSADVIVANNITKPGAGFAGDTNEVVVYSVKQGAEGASADYEMVELAQSSKTNIARQLIEIAAARYRRDT